MAIVGEANLSNLPDATIITAEIYPLRSEGKALVERLESAGSEVTYKNYDGVTHESFGMAAVVDDAKQAQMLAAEELRTALESSKTSD